MPHSVHRWGNRCLFGGRSMGRPPGLVCACPPPPASPPAAEQQAERQQLLGRLPGRDGRRQRHHPGEPVPVLPGGRRPLRSRPARPTQRPGVGPLMCRCVECCWKPAWPGNLFPELCLNLIGGAVERDKGKCWIALGYFPNISKPDKSQARKYFNLCKLYF